MSKIRPDEMRLRDPLSQVTRNERRLLLGVCAIGIVIVKAGLVPSKISALGIEFTQTDQRSLLFAIAAGISYLLIGSLIYAGSDFVAWRIAFRHTLIDSVTDQTTETGEVDAVAWVKRKKIISQLKLGDGWHSLSGPISVIRAVFEFIVPVVIGVYAIVILIRAPL